MLEYYLKLAQQFPPPYSRIFNLLKAPQIVKNLVMSSHRGLFSLAIGYLLASASANPVPEAEPGPIPDVSLPPVVPPVPPFTDPLSTLIPPLPVLQAPTPPKVSPPFTGSDIKPKKIGYFWTGAGDNDHAGI